MKIIRDSSQHTLIASAVKPQIDKTACVFFILGMLLASSFLQAFFA